MGQNWHPQKQPGTSENGYSLPSSDYRRIHRTSAACNFTFRATFDLGADLIDKTAREVDTLSEEKIFDERLLTIRRKIIITLRPKVNTSWCEIAAAVDEYRQPTLRERNNHEK